MTQTLYDALREFADSWALLAMFLFFVTAVFWAFRPSAQSAHDEAATIPFREE
jgi:cytochrome c oxidase cbb3-type subunit 4